MTPAPVIRLSDVGVDVPGRPRLLDGVDLTLTAGDRVAVVGPSGAGKSTLLAVIGAFLAPDRGTVHADDALGGQLLWVSQIPFTLPFHSVRDNVALAALDDAAGWRQCLQRADDACRTVGLGDVAASPARAVSGGERQRIGTARALVTKRRVILADEPTASLDRHLVSIVAEALFRKTAPDAIVVTATHDPDVADRADRRLRIVDGRVLENP